MLVWRRKQNLENQLTNPTLLRPSALRRSQQAACPEAGAAVRLELSSWTTRLSTAVDGQLESNATPAVPANSPPLPSPSQSTFQAQRSSCEASHAPKTSAISWACGCARTASLP